MPVGVLPCDIFSMGAAAAAGGLPRDIFLMGAAAAAGADKGTIGLGFSFQISRQMSLQKRNQNPQYMAYKKVRICIETSYISSYIK